MIYVYDGSFDGLLCCLYHHVYTEKAADIISEKEAEQFSLERRFTVDTETDKSERVAMAVETKISPLCLKKAYKAFLSCEKGREADILAYVFLGFKLGPALDNLCGHRQVRRIDVLNQKVNREISRMLGLLRFSALSSEGGSLLYASFNPVCDILPLIMPHFLGRYTGEPFVIHDLNRNKAAFARGGRWVMGELPAGFSPGAGEEEKAYRALWKRYFADVSIDQRTNRNLQRQFVPVRYRSCITEFQAGGTEL